MSMSEAAAPPRSFLVRNRTRLIPLIWAAALPLVIFIRYPWQQQPITSYVLETLGFAALVFGIFIRCWSTLYIGGRKGLELQRSGPYSLVRHPLYVGSLFIGVGLSLFVQNPLLLLLVLIYFWAQYRVTIRYEETLLAERFGEEHAQYINQVPCFLPSFGHADFTSPRSVDVPALRDEAVNCLVYLLFMPISQLIVLLQQHDIVPALTLTLRHLGLH
jgi:protein-S-isoprenylcysteine O-methyltransferase Ste14